MGFLILLFTLKLGVSTYRGTIEKNLILFFILSLDNATVMVFIADFEAAYK